MRQVGRSVVCKRDSKTQCRRSEGLKGRKASKLGQTSLASEQMLGIGFSCLQGCDTVSVAPHIIK